jgi:hypothetical protein
MYKSTSVWSKKKLFCCNQNNIVFLRLFRQSDFFPLSNVIGMFFCFVEHRSSDRQLKKTAKDVCGRIHKSPNLWGQSNCQPMAHRNKKIDYQSCFWERFRLEKKLLTVPNVTRSDVRSKTWFQALQPNYQIMVPVFYHHDIEILCNHQANAEPSLPNWFRQPIALTLFVVSKPSALKNS